MNRLRLLAVLVLACCLVFSSLHPVLAAAYDLGSAGLPTMGGSIGGSVTGSSTLLSALAVTVNFGELSPANPNQLVTVVIPIAMRSDSAYQVIVARSEEHTSELQSHSDLVCRLLLEKKNKK